MHAHNFRCSRSKGMRVHTLFFMYFCYRQDKDSKKKTGDVIFLRPLSRYTAALRDINTGLLK